MDDDDVARALPAYEVGRELGRGAYGRVVEGRHRRLDRAVAIKQLDASLVTNPGHRAAFLREARVLAEMSHPHLVQVYDFVDDNGVLLLVMEYLGGGSLETWAGDTTTPETACAAIIAACSGVGFAHEHGVLHRDLKLENLMFDTSGALKVTDFGVARLETDPRLTARGDVLGTPAYMAPEQAAGAEVDRRADVYSLGVTLYHLLSGEFPHAIEGGAVAVLNRRLRDEPQPLLTVAPAVPGGLAEVVMCALDRDPDRRPQSAEALGLAIGAAAWEAWGPDWMSRSTVDIRSPGPLLTATESPPQPAWRLALLDGGHSARPATATLSVGNDLRPSSLDGGHGRDREAAEQPSSRRSIPRWILVAVLGCVALAAVVGFLSREGPSDPVVETADSPAEQVQPRWTFVTGDEVFASPTPAGSLAIVGSVDGIVYGVHATTGMEAWRFRSGGPIRSTAAVAGETAYVGSFDGNLYAIDVADGRERWRVATGFEIVSSPVVVGDLVIVGSGDLLAFEVATGTPRWTFVTPEPVVSSPTLAGDTVYVGANDGQVYAVGLDGTERWRFETGGPVTSSPVVGQGRVYVGSTDGVLYAIDAVTGSLQWSTRLGAPVNSSPAVVNGGVVVGSSGGTLAAFDGGSGQEQWRLEVGAPVDSSPLVDGSTVYVGANDRRMRAVDAGSGRERWWLETGGVVLSSPALVGELVLVGSNDGRVYAVEAHA